MRASRGMGIINPTKMPKAKVIRRKDNPEDVLYFSKGGLYENIHKKHLRMAAGSGEKPRKPGSPGAPTGKAFRQAAKTVRKK